MMKRVIAAWLLGFSVLGAAVAARPCPAQSEEEAALLRRAALATKKRELAEALSALWSVSVEEIRRKMVAAMAEERHRTIQTSRELCREIATHEVDSRLEQTISLLLARETDAGSVSRAELLAYSRIDPHVAAQAALQPFAEAFEGARRDAVAPQAKRLAGGLGLPEFEEVDGCLTAALRGKELRWEVAEPALAALLARQAKGVLGGEKWVYEENEAACRSRGVANLQALRGGFEVQVNTLVRALKSAPEGLKTRTQLQAHAEAALRRAAGGGADASHREEAFLGGRPFSAVLGAVSGRAADAASARFEAWLPGAPVTLDAGSFKRSLEAALGEHETLAASMAAFTPVHEAAARKEAVAAWLGTGATEAEAAWFLELLQREAPEAAGVRGAFDRRFRERLEAVLRGVRGEIAHAQVARALPQLQEAGFHAGEGLIVRQQAALCRGAGLALAPLAKGLELFGLGTAQEPLLEETAGLAVARLQEELGVGVRALADQVEIVEELGRDGARTIRLREQVGRRVPKAEIVAAWQTDVKAGYAGRRPPARYAALFRATETRIEEVVSRLYDSVQKQAAAETRKREEQRAEAAREETARKETQGQPGLVPAVGSESGTGKPAGTAGSDAQKPGAAGEKPGASGDGPGAGGQKDGSGKGAEGGALGAAGGGGGAIGLGGGGESGCPGCREKAARIVRLRVEIEEKDAQIGALKKEIATLKRGHGAEIEALKRGNDADYAEKDALIAALREEIATLKRGNGGVPTVPLWLVALIVLLGYGAHRFLQGYSKPPEEGDDTDGGGAGNSDTAGTGRDGSS